MGKILSFGEILMRLASPGYTKLFQKDSFDVSFCGGEANVAVSLSVLGLDSLFLTVLPDNDVGDAALCSMKYFGVDVSRVIRKGKRVGLYYLEKGASQRPSKVIYDREYSAISLAEPQDFDWNEIFEDVSWFHWTGINPALSDNLAEISLDACKKAKEKGVIISCDLNYRSSLWSSEKAQKVMKKLMPYVDICIANEEDAQKVLGIYSENSDVELGKLNITGYEDSARKICNIYGCQKVAFTLRKSFSASDNGWSGMIYDSIKNKSQISKEYNIRIVDRVGGGDSFTAALIYSLIQQKSDQDAIEFAVAASCLKQTMEGDYNRAKLSDIENLLKSGGSGRVKR